MEEEKRIRSYFKQQVRSVIERSTHEPEGFLSYFVDHDPKDEEILGLLAVTTMMCSDDDMTDSYPTSVEALASLSPHRRSEICREFRKELKNCLRQISAA
jgi:hypothetical protein